VTICVSAFPREKFDTIGGAWCANPNSCFNLPFDRNDRRRINAQRELEMQARRNVLQILSETLHDATESLAQCNQAVHENEANQSRTAEDDAGWPHSAELL